MKKLLFIQFILLLFVIQLKAQNKMPNVSIRSLNGKQVAVRDIENGGKPIIISFWATWCKACLNELENMNEEYEDWKEETGVKIIAISTDDARSSSRVKSMVAGKQWGFDIYLDENQDLKRALNIVNIPYTIILDKNGEIAWKHTGYTPGNEEEVIEKVRELIK